MPEKQSRGKAQHWKSRPKRRGALLALEKQNTAVELLCFVSYASALHGVDSQALQRNCLALYGNGIEKKSEDSNEANGQCPDKHWHGETLRRRRGAKNC